MTEREHPQGTRFNYASAESDVLSLVIRGATGESLSAYLTPRLWQAIGAETSAIWRTDRTGHERSGGNFNATLRDYARLGIVLAHDGQRHGRQDVTWRGDECAVARAGGPLRRLVAPHS